MQPVLDGVHSQDTRSFQCSSFTLGKLELFLHDRPEPTPVLLKLALVHVQFEIIHPFLDVNGRLGRLLIPLIIDQLGDERWF